MIAGTREHLRVAFAGHDRADDGLPGDAHHVSEYFSELEVHLDQCLLHALHPAALFGEQQLALTHHRVHHADLAIRAPAARSSPRHELLQPLAILHVALAPGYILQLPRIDQPDLQPAMLEHFVHRDPVDSGGFERHGIDATRQQPVGQRVLVVSHRPEFAHRLVIGRPGDRYPMAGRAHIDPGRVRKHLVDFPPAHGHGLLPTGWLRAAPWETSGSTPSLKRDAARAAHQCHRRFPDHAMYRARHAASGDVAYGHQ